jgi:hypothetical protein
MDQITRDKAVSFIRGIADDRHGGGSNSGAGKGRPAHKALQTTRERVRVEKGLPGSIPNRPKVGPPSAARGSRIAAKAMTPMAVAPKSCR